MNGGETLDRPGLSDRAVLQRLHDGARAVSRLRRAAGQHHRLRARAPATGELYDVGGGESGYIAPDPQDPDVFYAGSYGGLLTRINRRTGEQRAINVWPDNPMGFSSGDITERFQWTFPIVIAPTEPRRRSTSPRSTSGSRPTKARAGSASARISRATIPSTIGPSGGPITLDQTGVETYATIFTLAPSAGGRQRHLGRLGRRLRARHARRRQELEERHADGPAAVHAHQPDRSVAARRRHGLPRRQPLSAQRPRAVRLQDRGLRQDVDEDRQRPRRPTTSRARSAKTRSARGCCSSAPTPASTSRSTMAPRGSRCSWTCRSRRCTASRSGTTTW